MDAENDMSAAESAQRLYALHKFDLLGSDSDAALDRFTRLAVLILDVPTSLISLIDSGRHVFKSQMGLEEPWASQGEAPLTHSLCKYVVAAGEPLIVTHTSEDPRLAGNLAITEIGIQAYAGFPITTPDDIVLGVFCVFDTVPREWTEREIIILRELTQSINTEIELNHQKAERQKSERAYRDLDLRYGALFTQTHDAVFVIDLDGVQIDANPTAAEMLGYELYEMMGMPIRQVVAPHQYAESARVIRELLAGETMPLYERIFMHKDGTEIPVEINAALVRDDKGQPLYIQSIVRDITRRKQAEQALRFLLEQQAQQNAVLDSILQSMADGVVVADSKGEVILYNNAARQMLGFGAAGHGGSEWDDHYPAFHADKVTPYTADDLPLRKAIQGEAVDEEEIFVQHPDHPNGLFTSRSSRPIRDANGNITGGVVVIHNITRRKETEQLIRRLNEELATANADLEAFGHTIAHDLKSPLHIMGSYIELMTDYEDMLPVEGQAMIEAIQRSAEQMTGMINNMLLFAQLRSVEETLRAVEMRPVIEAAVQRMSLPMQERGIKLTVADDLPGVLGYGPWLEEVFANLLSNAVKYIGKNTEHPTIMIRGLRQGDTVRYEVEDNGLGITPRDQARLFKMFERFHEGHAEGTGLGLSIVARIIAKLGGKIGVESTPKHGSTFWFSLPAA